MQAKKQTYDYQSTLSTTINNIPHSQLLMTITLDQGSMHPKNNRKYKSRGLQCLTILFMYKVVIISFHTLAEFIISLLFFREYEW